MMKRQKYIKDEQNGLTYTLVGDYYAPDISIDDVELKPIGRWGRLHRDYIQDHNNLLHNQLLLSGRLYEYLTELNEQAQTRLNRVIQQMKNVENVTDALKKGDAMEWVRHMNSIKSRAEEIILNEIIYR